VVSTLQAVSGAGLEGPTALELLDNVLPFIAGEEEKVEAELGKILGRVGSRAIEGAAIPVSAHCNRVSTLDGHLETVSVELGREVSAEEAVATLGSFEGDVAGLGLPSAPARPILVRSEPDRRNPPRSGRGRRHDGRRRTRAPLPGLHAPPRRALAQHGAGRGGRNAPERRAPGGSRPPSAASARLIVMKFGGTSVGDASRIAAVCDIVSAQLPRRPVVVVSALAGVTDLLVEALRAARRGDRESVERSLSDLERRHRWALGSVSTPRAHHDLALETDTLFEELRQLLRSMRILGEGTPRASDAVLAYGENLSR
jgi:hypothetical protein